MKRIFSIFAAIGILGTLAACDGEDTANSRDTAAVERQQAQYQIAQPNLLIQLYEVRNGEVTTHSVWRSDYGLIEGDCTSMGYGLPYGTSLTNPLVGQWSRRGTLADYGIAVVGQPEPNGVFASTNTSATWVFCTGPSGPSGALEPMYIEAKVTVYPGPVDVDYSSNMVVRRGDATVNITPEQ